MKLWRLVDGLRFSTLMRAPDNSRCGGKPHYVAAEEIRIYDKSMSIVRTVTLLDEAPRRYADERQFD